MKYKKAIRFTDEEILRGGALNGKRRFSLKPNETRIYLLINGSTVVYVGQSINLASRKSGHVRNKDFNDHAYIRVNKDIANAVEANYIVRFNPEYNKRLPKSDEYPALKLLKLVAFEVICESIDELLKPDRIAYTGNSYGSCKEKLADYISKDDFNHVLECVRKGNKSII